MQGRVFICGVLSEAVLAATNPSAYGPPPPFPDRRVVLAIGRWPRQDVRRECPVPRLPIFLNTELQHLLSPLGLCGCLHSCYSSPRARRSRAALPRRGEPDRKSTRLNSSH